MQMAPNYQKTPTDELVKHLDHIEGTLSNGLEQLNETLSTVTETIQFVDDALRAYRKRFLKQSMNVNHKLTKWYQRMADDTELRFPHRKIIEYLLTLYDDGKEEFKEAFFSRIVRHCKLGKNMAKDYLILLEKRRYIVSRDDGYRVHYRIRG